MKIVRNGHPGVSKKHARVWGWLVPLVALTLGSIAAAPAPSPHVPDPILAVRAVTAMNQLESDFYNQQLGLYSATEMTPVKVASLWPTSQVLSAAIHVAGLTGSPVDRAR